MKCSKCFNDFEEKDIHLSHDVPKYMCGSKSKADLLGRHYLCRKCHDIYEKMVFSVVFNSLPQYFKDNCKTSAANFAKRYFKKRVKEDGERTS